MDNAENNRFLGEAKISKLLLKFSIPCILSLLVSSLYNIVDQIFIGNSDLGYLGNAATTIVFPITIISVAFAWCFGDGAAAYLSICQGQNNTEHSHKSIGNAIGATFIASVLFICAGFLFMDNILYAFGASEATIGLARDYFTIILMGIPAYMLMNMMNAVIRADGSPAFSMASMLTGALINVILDPIFIFGFKWGIKGAAWATIIGQLAAFIISLVYFFRSKTFKISLKSFIPNMPLFGNVVKLGGSTFITQMSIVVISLVCNIMLVKHGTASKYGQDIPIAVIGIAMKVFTIVINLVVGVILGGQPILGYNFGARNYKRVKETFKLVLIATLVIGLLSTLVFELCPQAVIALFGKQTELYDEFAVMTFRIFLSLVTFTCTTKMAAIFFQSVGQPSKAAVVSLARDIVFFVPLVIILPLSKGIRGTLWAAPIADILGICVTAALLVRFFKSLDKAGALQTSSDIAEQPVIKPSKPGVLITIDREHGSSGKYIGQLVAQRLGIPYYYKEMIALAAQESGLAAEFISDINDASPGLMHELYLSTVPVQQAIIAQERIIRKIAESGSCVIVGRAAGFVLREHPEVVRVFIHAPEEYRIKQVMKNYGDTEAQGKKSIARSDSARAAYYKGISGRQWGAAKQYDLCLDGSIGAENAAGVICMFATRGGDR
jgi:putative MATE family efflux protein